MNEAETSNECLSQPECLTSPAIIDRCSAHSLHRVFDMLPGVTQVHRVFDILTGCLIYRVCSALTGCFICQQVSSSLHCVVFVPARPLTASYWTVVTWSPVPAALRLFQSVPHVSSLLYGLCTSFVRNYALHSVSHSASQQYISTIVGALFRASFIWLDNEGVHAVGVSVEIELKLDLQGC